MRILRFTRINKNRISVAGERGGGKSRTVALLLGIALFLFPGAAHAGRSQVYVGVGIGTAAAVGGGIISWNLNYSQQVKKQNPARERSGSIAGLRFEKENSPVSSFPFPKRFEATPPLWIELPLFQLRW
jgi:hypothetical protein